MNGVDARGWTLDARSSAGTSTRRSARRQRRDLTGRFGGHAPGSIRAVVAIAVLGLLLAGCSDPVAPADGLPNIVLVLTDDQPGWTIDEVPALRERAADALVFDRAYAATSVCCPSRWSLLTGRLPHNHGVLSNQAPAGGYRATVGGPPAELPTRMQALGYRTVYIGKYLNEYPVPGGGELPALLPIPDGWDDWFPAFGLNRYAQPDYFDFLVGDGTRYTRDGGDYLTDFLFDKAARFIRDAPLEKPLFVVIAPTAPHEPAVPAPRHAGRNAGFVYPKGPSFNEADVSDKPPFVRVIPRLSWQEESAIDTWAGLMLDQLLSVAEGLEALFDALPRLRPYVVVYTSDNGVHAGEHRLPLGKNTLYEEDVRVPLLVWGTDIAPGKTSEIVGLVDLAPTLIELGGGASPTLLDGQSLGGPLRGGGREGRSYLPLEVWGPRGDPWATGVVGDRWKYILQATGFEEVYDLVQDPWEAENLARAVPDSLLAELRELNRRAMGCRGPGCFLR